MRTSFHHQPEAQHPKSSAIHKLPADYPIYWSNSDIRPDRRLTPCVVPNFSLACPSKWQLSAVHRAAHEGASL